MITLDRRPAGSPAGHLLTPADPGWDAARTTFNLRLDQQPGAIAVAADAADVAAAVDHARREGLHVAAQGTGHGAGSLGDLSDTLLLRTSALDAVAIDPDARTVRVGAGARWSRVISPLSDLGLAALHGSSPHVGIAGYSLGGGIGWLARSHGLQTDAVTAVEVVTADGELVRATAREEPDLFWALRGGGGSFGAVTAIEFRVHPLPEVHAGMLVYPAGRSPEVLHTWASMLPDLPEALSTWTTIFHFPDVPEVPEPFRGGAFIIVMAAFQGPRREGEALLAPLRALSPMIDTLTICPPSALAGLALEEDLQPFPFLSTHRLLEDLPADRIDALLDAVGPDSGRGSLLEMVQLRHLGGALSRPSATPGARATLPGTVGAFALGMAADAAQAEAVSGALRHMDAALAPRTAGYYPNLVEERADPSAFFDAATWTRLRQVKTAYDPDDLFRGAHHVPPAT